MLQGILYLWSDSLEIERILIDSFGGTALEKERERSTKHILQLV